MRALVGVEEAEFSGHVADGGDGGFVDAAEESRGWHIPGF